MATKTRAEVIADLTVQCCFALVARERNNGSWPNGLPQCFLDYRDQCLKHLCDDNNDATWLAVVEMAVKNEAVRVVAALAALTAPAPPSPPQ